jgi:hypothetical protein
MSNSITSGAFRLLANSSRPGLFPDVEGGNSSPIALQIKYEDTFQPETSGPRQELLEADRLMRGPARRQGSNHQHQAGGKQECLLLYGKLPRRPILRGPNKFWFACPGSADPITNAIFFVVGQEIFVKQG